MKTRKLLHFLPVLALLHTSVISNAYADGPLPAEKEKVGTDILDSVKSVETLNKEVQAVGKPACPECAPKVEPHLRVTLEGDSVDLGKPYYMRANAPYIVYLKRTANSPGKIDLKLQNNYEECAKMFGGTTPNGSLAFGCMTLTRYMDEEISLNMKRMKKLKGDETEIIELKFSKKNPNNGKYEITIKNLSSATTKEDVSGKFFGIGSGYNVSLEDTAR